jgi:hypothetical protein
MKSDVVRLGIPFIALVLSALFVLGVWVSEGKGAAPNVRLRRTLFAALGITTWLGIVAALALSGLLARFDVRPPPMALWFGATILLPLGLGLSSFGRRLAHGLPFVALVGFQAFRLPLELVMHRAANVGIMPTVMSYSGYNFDIVSGITALVLGIALFLGNVPRAVVAAWNVLGLTLLVIVGTVAFLASPIFQAFGPDQVNVWGHALSLLVDEHHGRECPVRARARVSQALGVEDARARVRRSSRLVVWGAQDQLHQAASRITRPPVPRCCSVGAASSASTCRRSSRALLRRR